MRNLISIIVPVFNVENYIERCLQSIVKQTFQDIEIILIDDGSTDKSGFICDDYTNKDERIHVIHQKNKGVSAARNTGLQIAVGTYIVFVDSDDWVLPNYVETLHNLLVDNDADLAMIGRLYQNDNYYGKKVHITDDNIYKEQKIMNSEQTLDSLLDEVKFLGYVWNKIFKREIISENNLIFYEDVNIWEDMLFCCQYIILINKSVYCNKKLYVYNIRQNSATNSNNYINGNTKLLAAEKMLELCYKKSDIFTKNMKVIYASTAIRIVYSYLFSNGIYDLKIINEKIKDAKPLINTKGVPIKIKIYYLGLKYIPKLCYKFYRLHKKFKNRKNGVLTFVKIRRNKILRNKIVKGEET